jgi:oxalate decarboxylase/phosphoglucose isomerase-like protein (cupin superfamily)
MNVHQVITELKEKYPTATIVKNANESVTVTEIVAEIALSQTQVGESRAIAVIDSSAVHYHKVTTETYKVLKGTLSMLKYSKEKGVYEEVVLNVGDTLVINPGELHVNLGDEAWVEVVSNPAWSFDDYYSLDDVMKKYLKKG